MHFQRSDGIDFFCKVFQVAFDVFVELIQPLVALGVCSDNNRVNKCICAANMQIAEQSLEFIAQFFVFDDNGMFLTPKDTRKAGTSSCWRDSGLHWTTLGNKFFEWWRRGESNPRPRKIHAKHLQA